MILQNPFYNFRGMRVKLKESFALQTLPDIWDGKDQSLYRLDRWQPYSIDDKEESRALVEVHMGWVQTINDDVIYGLERWGALIPNEYTEWFSIIVIRHKAILASQALRDASYTNPIGQPHE